MATTNELIVKLWGVRGSLPRPETPARNLERLKGWLENFSQSKKTIEDFLKSQIYPQIAGFGGNTTCVEVRAGEDRLIVDAGSGLRELGGPLLATGLGKGKGEAHILMTHFHWDHLIGLPFFVPLFIPGNRIHIYAVQSELESVVRTMFKKPFFPVEFADLGAKIEFHLLAPRRKVRINGFDVTPYELDHPDPCWGYRVERFNRAYAHCVDTECTRQTAAELGPDLPLYQNADLMLFDAQYTLTEVVDKANWGHSVATFGLELALREKIKNVWFVHHDPYATDDKILQAARQAEDYYSSLVNEHSVSGRKFQPVNFSFAWEGIELAMAGDGK